MKNEIVIFENQKVKLEVNMQDETVWLNVKQMGLLFDREESNIRRHIINIFKENELTEKNNVQNLHVDGVKQLVPFYSLDVIISVVAYMINEDWFVTMEISCPRIKKDTSFKLTKFRHKIKFVQRLNSNMIYDDLFSKITK